MRAVLKATPFTEAKLKVTMTLDGYGLLTIQHDHISWNTKAGREPSDITINSQHWNPAEQEELLNRGSTRYLPPNVDLRTARIQTAKGRGIKRLIDAEENQVVIRISDVPPDEGDYEITITFTGDN